MKRRMRQALAVMLGLWLGWGAAAWATDESHKAGSGDHAAPAAASHDAGHNGGDHQADLGQTTAAQLVPAGSQTTWVKPLTLGIAGLFVAAVAIGIPALRLRGPLPPDPADTHDDHHGGAHGHDDHGHAHGHGHDKGHGHDHGHKH